MHSIRLLRVFAAAFELTVIALVFLRVSQNAFCPPTLPPHPEVETIEVITRRLPTLLFFLTCAYD